MNEKTVNTKTEIPAGIKSPAGTKRWSRILAILFLLLLFGLGAAQLHSLPLVQEVKTSFRESGIDVSAFTYSDVEEYREIKSGLRANPVR